MGVHDDYVQARASKVVMAGVVAGLEAAVGSADSGEAVLVAVGRAAAGNMRGCYEPYGDR